MRRRPALRGFALALALALACSRGAESPPYGFAASPEQRWRFEADETFDIDGTEAKSVRFAELILRAKPEPSGDTEVEVFLERYYARTQGTPTGESEISISEKGVSIQTPQTGRVGFGPNDPTLGGDTTLEMRARPVASVELDASGAAREAPWESPHPLLLDLALLDWLLLALPTAAPAEQAAWIATRAAPQTGRYRLGVELPVRWERVPGEPGKLRASAAVERASLRLDPGLEGKLSLEVVGSADVRPDGQVGAALLELRLSFAGSGGENVRSRHLVRATCTSCTARPDAPPVNSPGEGSDSAKEREGTPQQGYVDDLPDHGGVRRGL